MNADSERSPTMLRKVNARPKIIQSIGVNKGKNHRLVPQAIRGAAIKPPANPSMVFLGTFRYGNPETGELTSLSAEELELSTTAPDPT